MKSDADEQRARFEALFGRVHARIPVTPPEPAAVVVHPEPSKPPAWWRRLLHRKERP